MRWFPQAPASLRYTIGAVSVLALIAIVDIVRGDPLTGGVILGILVVFVGPILLLIVLAARAAQQASPPPTSPEEPGLNGHAHRDYTPVNDRHEGERK
jgi:hypothetical protein